MARKPKRRTRSHHNGQDSVLFPFNILSNYCGPGGAGRYRHETDSKCGKHDICYGITNTNRWRYHNYITHNKCDQEFLDELDRVAPRSLGEKLVKAGAKGWFNLKKAFAPHDPDVTPPAKRQKTDHGQTGNRPEKRRRPIQYSTQPHAIRRARRVKRKLGLPPSATPPEPVTSQSSKSMSGTTGTSETPVRPYKVARYIQEDYVTRHLKYVYEAGVDTTLGDGLIKRYSFRVNSPYDPCIDSRTNTQGVFNNSSFNGWAQLSRQYQFYRVLANQVKVRFVKLHPIDLTTYTSTWTNGTSGGGTIPDPETRKARANQEMQAAYKQPVVCGVAIDPGNRWYTRWDSITDWKNYAIARYNDITMLTGSEPDTSLEFKYNPNEWDAGIAIQQQEVTWTPMDQNPTRLDMMTLFYQSLGGSAVGYPAPQIKIIVEMDAVVQFREWSINVRADMYLPDNKGTTDDVVYAAPDVTSTAAQDLNRNDITQTQNMDVTDSSVGGDGAGS